MYAIHPTTQRRWTGAHPGPDAFAAYPYDNGLGIFGISIGSVVGAAAGLFGGGDDKARKEASRLAVNERALTAALGGLQVAGQYLRQRTGQFGIVNLPAIPEIGSEGGATGGWGTETARMDASRKYQILTAAVRQAGQPAVPVPPYTGPSVMNPPFAGATPAGVTAGSAVTPLVIGGLVLGGMLLLAKPRR